MKRITLLLTTAVLCAALLLSACAKTPAAEQTPETTPETTTPETTTPETTTPETAGVLYPLLVKADEAVKADLDGDGTEEEITYTVRTGDDVNQAVVTVNGTEFAADLADQGFNSVNPEASYCCLTDVDSSDKMLEIAVMDAGPSSDNTTSFFRYADGALKYLGYAEGYAMAADGSAADMEFHGFGTINSYMRLAVLQTWYAKADYRMSADGITVARQSLYTPKGEDGLSVTAKADLAAYSERDLTSEKSTVAAGTALTLDSTDNAEWVMALDADENEYWLHLDPASPFTVELADGTFAASEEALDGLVMAD